MNLTTAIEGTPGSNGLGQGVERCYDGPYAQRRAGHVCPTYQLPVTDDVVRWHLCGMDDAARDFVMGV